MCGDSGDSEQQTQTYSSTVQLPYWIESPAQRAIKEAERLGKRPYTPYTGTRVEGFTAPELEAQQRALAASRANMGQPELQAAIAATQGAAQFTPQTIPQMDLQAYMNPFLQNVSERTMADIGRQQTLQQQQLARQAASAGAFGGSRFGIAESENARNYADLYANQMAKMYGQAYESATGLAQNDLNRALEAQKLNLYGANQLANLGLTGRQMTAEDIAAASKVGEAQRSMAQTLADVNYQNFLEKRDWPERGLALRLSALGAVPYGTTTTGTTTGTVAGGGGNPLLGAAGGALTGYQFGGPLGAAAGGIAGGLC